MEFSAVDSLIAYFFVIDRDRGSIRGVNQRMRDAGYSEADTSQAWAEARSVGYTRSTGLAQIGSQKLV